MKGVKHYDYIILGTGLAGLQLAYFMVQDDFFKDKSILLLDKSKKQKNDRTWSYWEVGHGDFDNIVYQIWNSIYVGNEHFNITAQVHPYQYKMIKGIDFYNYMLGVLRTYKNLTFVKEEVLSYQDNGTLITVNTASKTYEADKAFNSLLQKEKMLEQERFPLIQQHFIGWFVKTEKPVFKVDRAGFMDFTVPQKGNTRFMYVLPFSETEALVEYTLFSSELLPKEEYEEAIEAYLNKMGTGTYEILEKEEGSIPMTSYKFHQHDSENLINIGTAGGWTKASTGFTFRNTGKKVKRLLEYMKKNEDLSGFNKKNRFWYYDLILLDVLNRRNDLGAFIFPTLFKKNKPQLIFKFLDEETNFKEEIKIMLSITHWQFIKAFFRRLF
ncbi:lycopene cyclase [Leptobacterium flavescens]|uniref:Lycopene cyclase n=1 Tax=Leptobacterium flavescens TaxID=472055 RepID=A0A6P0UKX5_9FLAO|nr:lycopene cyclase family protein [Leptobacterium flavescens]NER13070.1 lycopene cyclase [Leptobacterium flavescens]